MDGLPRIGLDIMGDLADEQDVASDGERAFRLENADSDIPPPEIAVRATREAVGEDAYNSWLPLVGLRDLRRAVADGIRRDEGLDYDWSSEVIITNGVQEGLLSTLLALLDPGDGVITPEPAYSGTINRIRLAHGVPLFVPLREERGWRLDLDALERQGAEGNAKAIVFNATNMPTGALYTRDELDAVADLARRRDLWVIYSAPTSRLTFDIERAPNIAAWPGMRERTIVLDGVSKDFNMTAWRIGWAVADRAVIEHIGKAHMYNGTLTSAFAQAGVIALLNDHAGGPRVRAQMRRHPCRARARGRRGPQRNSRSQLRAAGGWMVVPAGPSGAGAGRCSVRACPARTGQRRGDADGHLGAVDGCRACARHLRQRARRAPARGGCAHRPGGGRAHGLTACRFQATFRQTIPRPAASFRTPAPDAGAALTHHRNPNATGPDGGALYTDVARLGPADTDLLYIVASATHGVEGFLGSGC